MASPSKALRFLSVRVRNTLAVVLAAILASALLTGADFPDPQGQDPLAAEEAVLDSSSESADEGIVPDASDGQEPGGEEGLEGTEIVPMADQYVSDEFDLRTALASAADGDTIYLQDDIFLFGVVSMPVKTLTIASDMGAANAPFTISMERSGRHFTIPNGADITFTDLIIEGSYPTTNWNGGIDVDSATLTLNNVSVDNCGYSSGHGGGIYAHGSSVVTVTDSFFTLNHSGLNGGGIFVNDSTQLQVLGYTYFMANDAGLGGGIYANASSTVTINGDCYFGTNTADSHAGAIDFNNVGTNTLGGSIIFQDNSAGTQGGAIYVHNWRTLNITGSLEFTGNTGSPLVEPTSYPAGFSASQLTGTVSSISPNFTLAPGADLGIMAFNNYDIGPVSGPVTYTVSYAPGAYGTFAAQQYTSLLRDAATPAFSGTPTGQSGWVFTGWSPQVAPTVTSSVTYTAQWRQAGFVLTYNTNGAEGGIAPADATVYQTGDTVTLSGNAGSLAKAGYRFLGWSLTPGGAVVSAVTFDGSDITVYAVWEPEATAIPLAGDRLLMAIVLAAVLAALGACGMLASSVVKRRQAVAKAAGRHSRR
ncbi:MAG: InlB B-repeat-containing protein [Coriobacteriaceae bacterium]|nr:InlB B-repeat-containing protein [Coriobacteriaceae bacterium]